MRFTTAILASITLANTPAGLVGGRSLLDKKNRVLQSNNRHKVLKSLLSDIRPLWEQNKKGPARKQQQSIRDRITPVRNDHGRECDLDVGILKCDKDQVCVPSSHSKRGGICHPRRIGLQPRNLQPTLCETIEAGLPETYRCDCTGLDYATMQGSVKCATEAWCDDFDPSLCGNFAFAYYYYGSEEFQKIVYCVYVSPESFCASYDKTNVLSVSFNGCPCEYETTQVVCENDVNRTGILANCPYSITVDTCDSFGTLFGKGTPSCEAATTVPTVLATPSSTPEGTQVPTTVVPTNPPTQKPIMTKAPTTVVPTSPPTQKPNITTEAPTSAPPKTVTPTTTPPETARPTTPGSKENTTTVAPSNGEEITVNLATIFMAVAVFIGIWI